MEAEAGWREVDAATAGGTRDRGAYRGTSFGLANRKGGTPVHLHRRLARKSALGWPAGRQALYLHFSRRRLQVEGPEGAERVQVDGERMQVSGDGAGAGHDRVRASGG